MNQISVTILTKNSAETLSATLDSCKSFVEVLIFDTGSTDETLNIAKSYPNVRIIEEPFTGFGPAHNAALKKAKFDWILSLDSDEILSLELLEEIAKLSLNKKNVYSILRCNYFGKKWIRCCSGWHPDWNIRLFHRHTTQFTNALVHETVESKYLQIVPLQGKMLHTPYRSIDQLLSKMQTYSSLFAEQNAGKKKSSLQKAILHGIGAFLKNYFLKRGFLGGREGFIISLYNAQTTYYKYLKLAWRNSEL